MKSVGDIDNALVNMVFENGTLGTVQLSRNAVFGYDIRTEIWGTKGSIQIGYFQHTPILVMTQEGITHDVVPHFMQRFEGAYLTQIQDFVDKVRTGQRAVVDRSGRHRRHADQPRRDALATGSGGPCR